MLTYKISLLSVFIFIYSCAVQGLPSGGEKDNYGPEIDKVFPLNNEKNINENEVIEIYFNEIIQPNNLNFLFNVYPEVEFSIKYKRNKIELSPKTKWPEGSFSIIVDRGVKDYNGNSMRNNIYLSYSTNDNMSYNVLNGKVHNYNPTSIYNIGLFEVDPITFQLNLILSIQSNNKGEFAFNNIKDGDYLVVALSSEIGNIYEDIRVYDYCISSEIINFVNKSAYNINLYMNMPAERLEIKSLNPMNQYFGSIVLSNASEIKYISNLNYFDNYIDGKKYIKLNGSNSDGTVKIKHKISNNIESYEISGMYAINSNFVDTLGPRIESTYFNKDNLHIIFSEPVLHKNNINALYVKKDSVKHLMQFDYFSPNEIFIQDYFEESSLLYFENNAIFDLVNNSLIDSSLYIEKTDAILSKELSGGSVMGIVSNYEGKNNFVVVMYDLENKNNIYRTVSDNDQFIFKNINPGNYSLEAYENINPVNYSFFNGLLKPLKLSAKFGIYEKNIEVRSNWDLDGINVKVNER